MTIAESKAAIFKIEKDNFCMNENDRSKTPPTNQISEELRSAIFTANSLALLLNAFSDNMDEDALRLANQLREQLQIAVSLVGS